MSNMEEARIGEDPEWVQHLKEGRRDVVHVPKEIMDQMLEALETEPGVSLDELRDRLIPGFDSSSPQSE
jgi:hypothetical protein